MDITELFKLLSKKLYNKEIVIPKDFTKYQKLLEKCRSIKGITAYNKLLLTLFDITLLENGVPKKNVDQNLLKCLKLVLEDDLENSNLVNYVYFQEKQLTEYLRNKKIFSIKDLRLLSLLMTVKEDFKLFFRCFEEIYIEKCEKYIPGADIGNKIAENSFKDNLNDFSLLFNALDIKNSQYFSIISDKGWFLTITKTQKEASEYMAKIKQLHINDVISFINNNLPKLKNVIKSVPDNKSQIITQNEKEFEKKKEINLTERIEMLEKGLKEKDLDISKLQSEINELKKIGDKTNKSHRINMNNLDKKLKEFQKKYELTKIENEQKVQSLLIKHQSKLLSYNLKINQLKASNKSLKQDINDLRKELDTIKARTISKSIIDFISYSLGKEDINIKYLDKFNFIINKLNEVITKEKSSDLWKELKELINRIEEIKFNGDSFAHSDMQLEYFFNCIQDCPNAKKILLDLNLSPLVEKCKELYKLQNQKIDYSKVYDSVVKIMESKKKIFCEKFGFK